MAAFGFFLIRLNVFLEAVGGGSIPHLLRRRGAVVLVAIRYAELAMVAIGIAIVARSDFALGAARAIDRDELSRSRSPVPSCLLAAALAIAVLIFCINLAPI